VITPLLWPTPLRETGLLPAVPWLSAVSDLLPADEPACWEGNDGRSD
jgi:hypothetical protein